MNVSETNEDTLRRSAPDRPRTDRGVSPRPSSRLGLERLIVVAAVVVPVLYALVVNLSTFDNPPAWDSAVTVSPAALTIVDLDFDIWQVAQLPSSPEGGPSTHATSIYTIGLAGLIWVLGAEAAFFAAHVASIGMIGLLASGTFLLARQRASVVVSALVAGTTAIIPVVVQQAADVYLDLPLAAVTTFAVWTTSRRKFWWTAGLIAAGVAIKTSGVFLLPLLLFARPEDKPLRRHLTHVVLGGLAASIPFLVSLATTHRFGTESDPFGDLILVRSSASLLVLTVDVFVILSLYVLVLYGRARAHQLDRVNRIVAIVLASFFAVHVATMLLSGTIAILPRYYIVILPAVLTAAAPGRLGISETPTPAYRLAVWLLVLLGVFSVVNVRGDLYPLPDHDFYVAAERSTRAQELLALHEVGTEELASLDLPLLVERQVHFRLEYPGMGYVEKTPDDVTPVFIEPVTELPDEFAMLIERRFTNPLVEIEQAALDQGYELEYTEITSGPFRSDLVVASR